ncbi:hypothetical protein HPB50_025958 [Hyalomma asiaticum]|uniref:Uncharacterized protein n=1 Tax=Hyalomma asiaticum TaxID=266040 RepID=A0ACB7SZP3_HYAAI|nr:hypothetical protein HPB50_025958 [Hyalomma asiaticum]
MKGNALIRHCPSTNSSTIPSRTRCGHSYRQWAVTQAPHAMTSRDAESGAFDPRVCDSASGRERKIKKRRFQTRAYLDDASSNTPIRLSHGASVTNNDVPSGDRQSRHKRTASWIRRGR